MKFAIIGAGMAGLSCADVLEGASHDVTLFDKGRGPGGRMSTRRLATSFGEVCFDHGAQYFTVRDPAFVRLVSGWSDLGIVSRWPLAGDDAWVGVPGMNAVIRQMAASHPVKWSSVVTSMGRRQGQWWVTDGQGESGPFDAAILAVPAEQAAAILSLHDFQMARVALLARSQPCWAGMFVFDHRLDALPDVIRQTGNLAWAARNSAKPGRSGPEAWVVQGTAPWSSARLEQSAESASALLLAALGEAVGRAMPQPVTAAAHRWRYALSSGTGDGALWNSAIGLGVCGDWLLGPRVECAWLSGRMLAQRCLGLDGMNGLARAIR
ncbi:MAG: NAD/FAD-dependent oxidoreductase [Alphaproteobacteria bacterium]|nr:NAD/FAD-dependent oxidoreductase [Alphaproteobacteria bacterium]